MVANCLENIRTSCTLAFFLPNNEKPDPFFLAFVSFFVFFDDLIRDRVKLADLNINLVREHLQKNSVNQEFIHFPNSEKKIVLWGHGLQARWLSGSTNCGHSGLIIDTVSDEAQYFHKRASEGLSDLLIYPSGVQSIYEIIKNIEDAKLGDRLLRGVLI